MSIGIIVSKTDLDNVIGNKARDFWALYASAKALSARLKLFADSDLTAIGYSAADVAAIHAFEQVADTLCGLFDGTATLPTATNFLQQVSGIIGTGM